MNGSSSLKQLLTSYQPVPRKPGALIRAAVRLTDRMDIPARLVMDLRAEEVAAGSRLFYFICEATNVGGAATPSGSSIRTLALDDIPGSSLPYAWLVILARACVNSLSMMFTMDEVLKIVEEIETVFSFAGFSEADVEHRFRLETSRSDWAQALFR